MDSKPFITAKVITPCQYMLDCFVLATKRFRLLNNCWQMVQCVTMFVQNYWLFLIVISVVNTKFNVSTKFALRDN